jgi:perosamine synthetase
MSAKTVSRPELACEGGLPVRESILPYGHQWLDDDDIAAVVEVLQSDWMTTGPKVGQFERVFAEFVGAREAVAVSNGTAALHAAVYALKIGPGDEVIVPALTFAASANCVVYQGGTPVFVDVDEETLLIDPGQVETKITSRTKAIVAVDYAGHPCNYQTLREISERHSLSLIADACHAIGGSYQSRPVGSLANLNTFSFHPVKHITTGEGGMISTNDPALARRMRAFRNHGITSDHRQREAEGSWFYEMVDLGFNYRLTDFQCALGIRQLSHLRPWVQRRQQIARMYDRAFVGIPEVRPPAVRSDVSHAYHLYVVRLQTERLRADRATIFSALRAEGIGVNVHYIPVPWHPFYQRLGHQKGSWPRAEDAYERMISLPIFPAMSDSDVEDVIEAVRKVISAYRR